MGWAVDGADRHDSVLFEPTLKSIEAQGLIEDIGPLHPGRAYDSQRVRDEAQAYGVKEINCAKNASQAPKRTALRSPPPQACAGPSNAPTRGCPTSHQLRRNTDRQPEHRLSQLCLAIALIITIKLIDRRDHWNPTK